MEDVKINGTVTISNPDLVKVFDRINRNLLITNKRVGVFEDLLAKIINYKNRVINEIIDNYSLNSSYDCCTKIIVYEKALNKDFEKEVVEKFDDIILTIKDVVKKNFEKYNEKTVNFSDEQITRENKAYESITNIINEITQTKEYNIQIIKYIKNVIATNKHKINLS